MPKISIIIPVYGVESYIERCARSLFDQTLDDMEYIFVNDCTPDSSMEILQRVIDDYPSKAEKVRILKTAVNSGQHIARQLGIEVAAGNYITHCDPDDAYASPRSLETAYKKAIETDADIVWYDICKVMADGRRIVMQQESKPDKSSVIENLLRKNGLLGSLWNRLVRSSIAKSDKVVVPKTNVCEDMVLVAQYHILAQKSVYLNQTLYLYYQNLEGTLEKGAGLSVVESTMAKIMTNYDILFEVLNANKAALSFEAVKKLIDLRKYGIKRSLMPVAIKKGDHSVWLSAYPEINYKIITSAHFPIRNKIIAALILARLYIPLKKLWMA